jgi:hypothetical protein
MMFIALVAVLALWATGSINGNGIGGASSNASLSWNVEYLHQNADGDVLQQNKAHNTVTVEGLETAMNRLIDDGTITAGGTAASDNILRTPTATFCSKTKPTTR